MNPDQFRNSPSGQLLRSPKGYWAFLPHPLPPTLNWSGELVAKLSEADRALGELAGLGHTLANPYLLIRPFLRQEAVSSSRIEGTHASLEDLYVYEAVQLPMFEVPGDVREVHNYVQALEYGLARLESLPISLRLMRELHVRLMESVRGEIWTPGEFRRTQNWIGPPGSTLETAPYVPPPPDEMIQALGDLEKFIHASSTLPPLVRLALIHYQFEAIHPFLDGNGRIGRLLISLLMQEWRLLPQPLLYLSTYFETTRPDYYRLLLEVSRSGVWEAWLIYFLEGIVQQARETTRRIQALQNLREGYRVRFQDSRSAGRLYQVLDILFENPLLTVQQIAQHLDVHYPAAKRYVEQMEEAGILQEMTGQVRNRVYRASEIMRILQEG